MCAELAESDVMREIVGQAKSVHDLLVNKYTIDHYQREYKWETKQIQELLEDLTGSFLENYEEDHPRERVAKYGRYFLGSIIISKKSGENYIVDGQQRLTSLTLLLIYLRNLQRDLEMESNIDSLILSVKFGKKSFNLDVEERTPALESLFDGTPFDETNQPESVQTILARYRDIGELFPTEISGKALPYFVDWLIENVDLVEITAYSDDDAYTIFETMKDRGLSLTPADMLKGFLIARITDSDRKTAANDLWKQRTLELSSLGKEVQPDFFKAWLRSQYANRIRERKKGARPEDFDRIGTEFHRWVRQHADEKGDDNLVLRDSEDYYQFIAREFDFYAKQYMYIMRASSDLVPGMERLYYLNRIGFTLYPMVMLAPLKPSDSPETIQRKIRLISIYLEILLARRLWNFRSTAYSTMQYAMFIVMRDIRGKDAVSLAKHLCDVLDRESEDFSTNDRLYLHQQNRWNLHWLLARMTDYVEQESGRPSHYREYINAIGHHRYEVEHIWANKPEEHASEFEHPLDFQAYRNRFGGLLLLPKRFNASYGALPYAEKVEQYYGQNLLAQSLNERAYKYDPGFTQFRERTGLPFRPHSQFSKADLDERRVLYQMIAEHIWNPVLLLQEPTA
jgi:uncharacterized protein with ParB-like and HNH nuclease domain